VPVLGLTFDKLLIIAVIAVFLIGPTKLPAAAARLGQWVRRLRAMADSTTDRIRQEVGPEFDDIDWKRLDPRQYDPRQIIRRALEEPTIVAAPPAPPEPSAEVQEADGPPAPLPAPLPAPAPDLTPSSSSPAPPARR
jgi:sec-independent protein translocase protein TatB